ncbi:MAG: hypothetical protein QOF50_1118, partial [Gaiellaceae bacterium]|nr:hypothetical protein [Gaiellaceae bacterium]
SEAADARRRSAACRSRAGRAKKVYVTGFPTRVVIRGRTARRSDLTLRGYSCDSGLPLRFWYRNQPLTFPFGFPATEEELQQKGDLSVKFPATKKLGEKYSGYMLFWAPGDWRLVLTGPRPCQSRATKAIPAQWSCSKPSQPVRASRLTREKSSQA